MKNHLVLASIIALSLFCSSALAKENKSASSVGKLTFQQHCASCHQDGMNLVNNAKPVAGSKELRSLALFKAYLAHPPGHMPYYEHLVKDQKVLQALYDYCKSLKLDKNPVVSQATSK